MDRDLDKYNHLNYSFSQSKKADGFVDFLLEFSKDDPIEVDENEAWDTFKSRLQKENSSEIAEPRSWSFGWQKVAASVAILMGLGIVFFTNSKVNELTVVAEENRIDVEFPDGSKGVLNAHSSFSYPEQFGNERRVTFQGEAYFDIVKSEKPFVISMGEVDVKVLGTAFNLKSSESTVNLYVERGLVAFEKDGVATKVSAGSQAIFYRDTDSVEFEATPNANIMSWRDGRFNFDDTSLADVLAQLETYYDVAFEIRNQSIEHCSVSASFEKQTLSEVMSTLEAILDIEVSRETSKVVISGKGC